MSVFHLMQTVSIRHLLFQLVFALAYGGELFALASGEELFALAFGEKALRAPPAALRGNASRPCGACLSFGSSKLVTE